MAHPRPAARLVQLAAIALASYAAVLALTLATLAAVGYWR
jgi:hypothetical protein